MKLPISRILKSIQRIGRKIFGLLVLILFPFVLVYEWVDEDDITTNIKDCFDAWCDIFWRN